MLSTTLPYGLARTKVSFGQYGWPRTAWLKNIAGSASSPLVARRPGPGCRPAGQAEAYPTSERPAILWDKLQLVQASGARSDAHPAVLLRSQQILHEGPLDPPHR